MSRPLTFKLPQEFNATRKTSTQTYMSSVDVYSQFADLNLCKSDQLATKPVTLKDLVCKAIQSESEMERVVDDVLGEYTDATAEHSTAICHTNICCIITNVRSAGMTLNYNYENHPVGFLQQLQDS